MFRHDEFAVIILGDVRDRGRAVARRRRRRSSLFELLRRQIRQMFADEIKAIVEEVVEDEKVSAMLGDHNALANTTVIAFLVERPARPGERDQLITSTPERDFMHSGWDAMRGARRREDRRRPAELYRLQWCPTSGLAPGRDRPTRLAHGRTLMSIGSSTPSTSSQTGCPTFAVTTWAAMSRTS